MRVFWFICVMLAPVVGMAQTERLSVYDSQQRVQSWTLHQTATRCIANTNNTTILFNNNGLSTIVHPSVDSGKTSISDGSGTYHRPDLFRRGLSNLDLNLLSKPGAAIMIEETGRTPIRLELAGLAQVLEICRFQVDKTDDPTLRHLQEAEQHARNPKWQHVPHTKPQIEFAIRAQDGQAVRLPGRSSSPAE